MKKGRLNKNEMAYIKEHVESLGADKVAENLERTTVAVKQYMRRAGLTQKQADEPHKPTEQEIVDKVIEERKDEYNPPKDEEEHADAPSKPPTYVQQMITSRSGISIMTQEASGLSDDIAKATRKEKRVNRMKDSCTYKIR